MKHKGLFLLCFLILPVLLLVSFNVFADENSGTERTTEV
ncbi:hypothetical protein U995_02590, partial [Staphylococcus aureus 1111203374]